MLAPCLIVFVALKSSRNSKIFADQLHSWSLLGDFRAALEAVAPCPRRIRIPGGPERLLTEEDYLSAFLFAQFNPVIDSMNGLCAASQLKAVQQKVCSRIVFSGIS